MVFTIYGHGGHLGHVTRTIWINFHSPILRSLHMKFEFNWPSGFRGEDVWKCWRTDGGVTGILIAHLGAFGSGELEIKKNFSKVLNTFEWCNFNIDMTSICGSEPVLILISWLLMKPAALNLHRFQKKGIIFFNCLHSALNLLSADFFQNYFYQKILSGILWECQRVWIHIRTDILSVLIWVQTVFKGYQQMTKVCWLFSKLTFSKKSFRNTIRVSNIWI